MWTIRNWGKWSIYAVVGCPIRRDLSRWERQANTYLRNFTYSNILHLKTEYMHTTAQAKG